MPAKKPVTTAQVIARYEGFRGHSAPATKEQWEKIAPVFALAMAPLASGSVSGFRKHCAHFVRLGVFCLEMGAPLELAVILRSDIVEAFVATQSTGEVDARSALRRLAGLHGLDTEDDELGYEHREPQDPYSPAEFEALLAHAAHLSTEHRRVTMGIILHMAAGAGVVRGDLSVATASDLHEHASGLFVVTPHGCRYVLESSKDALLALAAKRPEGLLLSHGDPTNAVSRAAIWTKGRKGVPVLSADRLRATYLERLLAVELPVAEALSSIQLKNLGRLHPGSARLATCSLGETKVSA